MSTTTAPASTQEESIGARLRNAAMAVLFATVLVIPKLLHIRRDPRAWTAFRLLLAVGGAGLVILPLSRWNSWTAGVAGIILFLAAILLPAEKPDTTVSDTAARLGALVVVNGGEYQPENDRPLKTQLFVGAERIWALDPSMQPLLSVATGQVISAVAAESGSDWVLRLRWSESSADFRYRGIFAEHLARVAESTLRSVIHPALPVLPPQKRAATA
jgi:hypothetical protein